MDNTKRFAIIKTLRKDFVDYDFMGMDERTMKQNLMHTVEHYGFDLITAEKVAQEIIGEGKVLKLRKNIVEALQLFGTQDVDAIKRRLEQREMKVTLYEINAELKWLVQTKAVRVDTSDPIKYYTKNGGIS